jgi:hypothetical protein
LIAEKFNKFFVNIASETEKTIPPADQPLQQPALEPATFLNMSHPIISQDIIDVIKQRKPKLSLDPYNLIMVLIKKY